MKNPDEDDLFDESTFTYTNFSCYAARELQDCEKDSILATTYTKITPPPLAVTHTRAPFAIMVNSINFPISEARRQTLTRPVLVNKTIAGH